MAIGNPITLTSNVASKTISVIATAGQTLFTVTGGYRINQLAVFRNGVRLLDGRDYEARNGSTVTLLSAATVGDALEFQVFDDFRVADAIVSAESEQTISGNLTVSGGMTVAGLLTATDLSLTDISLRHLETTGISTVSDTTQSTSTTTGAFIVSGGVGIAKSLFVGGNVSVGGTLSYEDVTNVDSVGVVTARAGIRVTGDSIHVESSEDRLLYLKSTDANAYLTFEDTDSSSGFANRIGSVSDGLYFSTGGGGERARIDSDGHFMVGQTSPYTATGAGNTVATFTNSGNYRNNLVVSNQTNGTDSGAAVVLAAHGNDWIIEAKGLAKGQRSLAINSGSTEALRVNFDGSVGIGTTIADRALHVLSSNGTVAHFESSNANTISQIVFEGLGASAPPNLGATGEHLHFTTNNLERLRITSAGLVGVGTVGPTHSLHVYDTTDNSAQRNDVQAYTGGITIQNQAEVLDAFAALRFNFHGDDSFYLKTRRIANNNGEFEIGQNYSSTSTDNIAIKIDNSLNVGIGTTIPGGKLQIDGGELLLGTKTVKNIASTTNATAIFRDDAGSHTIIAVESHATAGGGVLALSASRNSTDNGFTILQNGDVMGEIRFAGDDGTNLQHSGARIRSVVDRTPAEDDMPGRLEFLTNPGGALTVERLRITSIGTFHFKNGAMIENGIVDTTARNGTQAVNLDNGMVHYFQSSSTGTWKPNFRVNSTNTLNDAMSNGDICSPTMIVNKSNTAHYADTIQVDGSDVTPEWLGGAPTEGGGNNTWDIYSYTILKTGDAAFKCFASVSNYT